MERKALIVAIAWIALGLLAVSMKGGYQNASLRNIIGTALFGPLAFQSGR